MREPSMTTLTQGDAPIKSGRAVAPAALACMGIVFGDIGTSPLYTLQAIIQTVGGQFTPAAAIDVLSLILWALVITISVRIASS